MDVAARRERDSLDAYGASLAAADEWRPDWSRVGERLGCPLCDYDLRGLEEPRCPECGYRFDWRDLTDPARRKHPFLFEHHPQRNCWSFLKTLFASLSPSTFWTSLRPSQPSNLKRLLLYALILTLFAALVPVGLIVRNGVSLALEHRRVRQAYPLSDPDVSYPLPPNPLFFQRLFSPRGTRDLLPPLITAVAWPWFTFTGLLIFQLSMLKARVDNVHVLRCVVYSWDVVVWPVLLLAAAVAHGEYVHYTTGMRGMNDFLFGLSLWLAFFTVAAFTYRLWRAYENYLQFDRPFATVFCSQLIAFMMALVVFNLNSVTHGWVPLGF